MRIARLLRQEMSTPSSLRSRVSSQSSLPNDTSTRSKREQSYSRTSKERSQTSSSSNQSQRGRSNVSRRSKNQQHSIQSLRSRSRIEHDTVKKSDVINSNPHLGQNSNTIPTTSTLTSTLDQIPNTNTILPTIFSTKYWTEVGSLFTFIDVLTHHSNDDDIVLFISDVNTPYVGILSGFFPSLNFYVSSSVGIDISVPSTTRLTVDTDVFSIDTFREWLSIQQSKRIILLSDSHPDDGNDQYLRQLIEDLNPVVAVVRFNLPVDSTDSVSYLAGSILLPVYSKQSGNDTFLLVTNTGEMMYDPQDYNRRMKYYNSISRVMYHTDKIDIPGLDHCHDCMSVQHILDSYLKDYYNVRWSNDIQLGVSSSREVRSVQLDSRILFDCILKYLNLYPDEIRVVTPDPSLSDNELGDLLQPYV